MTFDGILNCVMCFLAGGGMMMLVLISAQRPSRKVLARWDAYKRADNARRRSAQKRRMERTARG